MSRTRVTLSLVVTFIVVVAAAAVHVLPHRTRALTVADEFRAASAAVSTYCDALGMASTVDAVAKATSSCSQAIRGLHTTVGASKSLAGEATWLRQAFSPAPIDLAAASAMTEQKSPKFDQVTALLASAFNHQLDQARSDLLSAANRAEIDKATAGILPSLETGILCLRSFPAAEPDGRRQVEHFVSGCSDRLRSVGNAGTEAVIRAAGSVETTLVLGIQKTDSVRDVNTALVAHLEELGRLDSSLATVSSFGPIEAKLRAAQRSLTDGAQRVKGLVSIVESAIQAQTTANAEARSALVMMDEANAQLERLERNASASVISGVHDSWVRAVGQLDRAAATLRAEAQAEGARRIVWTSCNKRPLGTILDIRSKAQDHAEFVYSKYREAAQEEATIGGSMARTARRGLDRLTSMLGRAMNSAAESRIGQEIGISAKMLILGTKAFYDLQNPDTDPLTWANSYSGDVTKLMTDYDAVQRMPGASITGKNTLIERLVNDAYTGSFKK